MSAAMDPGHVERFRALIARHLGLQFDDAKHDWLAEVLGRRLGRQPAELYLARLAGGVADGELAALAPELTVADTYFFRHVDHFHALRERVRGDLAGAGAAQRRLQILSAGCASGEEAYSIAMMLWDLVPDPASQLSIRAVDLNPVVIDKARRARYTAWALRETPQAMRQRWFRQEGSEFVLDESLRAVVTFDTHNLCDDGTPLWRPRAYDFIFCRNVLMYFAPSRARAVVALITRSLRPGGCLFLGHAETLRGLSQDYHLRHDHGSFHYERKGGVADDGIGIAPSMNNAVPRAVEPFQEDWAEAIGKSAERIRTLTAQVGAPAARNAAADDGRRPLDRALDLFGEERFAEALAAVQALPEASARNPAALLLQAMLLVHGGRLAQAEDTCHRLLVSDALNAGAHYVLALCREGAGDRRGAADRDQMAARLDPSFAMPRLHLGLLARRDGDHEVQRRELTHAQALLAREDASRLLLFGGGFGRDALLGLCRAGLQACGVAP